MRAHTIAAVTAALLLVAVPHVAAQGSLDAARELYASAEYDGALAMLNTLLSDESPMEERQTIEMYRVLCFVATGREAEADGAIAELVGRHPLFRPSDDVPPRVRSTFNEARKRLLPAAVQSTYQDARRAYDVKDYSTAERGFALVLAVLSDPDIADQATQSPLADLRVLATGFHELSAKVAAATASPSPPSGRVTAKIYTADDPNVVPPIALNQRIPSFRGPIRSAQAGVIEIVINDAGLVESASMRASIDPQYDRLALAAAKSWLYQPARVDGVPVKFLKRIQLNMVPDPR